MKFMNDYAKKCIKFCLWLVAIVVFAGGLG